MNGVLEASAVEQQEFDRADVEDLAGRRRNVTANCAMWSAVAYFSRKVLPTEQSCTRRSL
jgi:hypothetical protein